MNSKRFKKLLAGMLAATMVLGMNVTAFAQTGTASGTDSSTGDGSFEGHVDKEVVSITLPTVPNGTYNYIMDPEGLIAATEGANHSGSTFEEGANVYFLSAENTYTDESAKMKVINKGTVEVDVTVVAKTDENDNVTMADSDSFEVNDEAAKLYLGLHVASQDVKAVTTAGATVTVGLLGNEANFEIKPNASKDGYEYAAKDGVTDAAWNSFEFYLSGKCNPNGDYSTEGLAASDVTVTWSFAVRAADSTAPELESNATDATDATNDAAPSIATTSYTYTAGSNVEVPVNLGAGTLAATDVTSVTFINDSSTVTSLPDTRWSYSDGVLIFNDSYTTALSGKTRTHTVTFNDDASTTVDVTLTPAP